MHRTERSKVCQKWWILLNGCRAAMPGRPGAGHLACLQWSLHFSARLRLDASADTACMHADALPLHEGWLPRKALLCCCWAGWPGWQAHVQWQCTHLRRAAGLRVKVRSQLAHQLLQHGLIMRASLRLCMPCATPPLLYYTAAVLLLLKWSSRDTAAFWHAPS